MVEFVMDADTLRVIQLFENLTGARVKDVVEEKDRTTFLVEEGQVGKAIGKGAANIKLLREHLKKDIEIVGYSKDREQFVKNLFHRFAVESVAFEARGEQGEIAKVKVPDAEKGKAIGKGGRNVALARALASRHADVIDVVLE
ncbi:MAG: NusA-like transcription termination signal-binding factor [Thermoplasmatota archaeon]